MSELTDLLGAAIEGSPELQENAKRFAGTQPKPDPEADLKAEHQGIVSNWMLETFRDGYRDPAPPPYEAWRDAKLGPAKEAAAAKQEAADAKAAAATTAAALASAQRELKRAEVQAQQKRIAEVAKARAIRKGRSSITPKDRAWAVERLKDTGEIK